MQCEVPTEPVLSAENCQRVTASWLEQKRLEDWRDKLTGPPVPCGAMDSAGGEASGLFALPEPTSSTIVLGSESPLEVILDLKAEPVLVGTDAEQLYPSLEIGEVSELIYRAVLESNVTWQDLDYMD